ncbi:hypothetical protein [Nitrosomonas communis]|uniref:hypothetical protein n=1 Tax=Nitrosomonas communis TaxID=44574 RepID=UPI003D2826FB
MAISTQQKEDVIALYVATFNAAPGAQRLDELTKKIEAGTTLQQLADEFVETDDFKNGILEGAATNEEIAKKLAGNFSLTADNPDAQVMAFFNDLLTKGTSKSGVIKEADEYLRGSPVDEFKATADLFKNKITVAEVYSRDKSDPTLDQLQAVLKGVTSAYPKTEAEAEAFLAGGAIITPPPIKTQEVVEVGDIIETANNIVLGTAPDKPIYNDQAESNNTNMNDDGTADMGITLTGVTTASFNTTNFYFA